MTNAGRFPSGLAALMLIVACDGVALFFLMAHEESLGRLGSLLGFVALPMANLFALALLTWAVFAPPWLSRALAALRRKLVLTITAIGLVFVSTFALFVVGFTALDQLGLLN